VDHKWEFSGPKSNPFKEKKVYIEGKYHFMVI
jgi:hypothetical protein